MRNAIKDLSLIMTSIGLEALDIFQFLYITHGIYHNTFTFLHHENEGLALQQTVCSPLILSES